MSRPRLFSGFAFCLIAASCLSTQIVHAQTQASCTFHLFTLGSSAWSPVIYLNGVNDYGTVVGNADFGPNASPRFRAFIRYSNGGTHYVVPTGAISSSFGGRNDAGITTGTYYDSSNLSHPFLLNGSTMSPYPAPRNSGLAGINKYVSVVGSAIDLNGVQHGFKHYKNGITTLLDYPGAKSTTAVGVNDSGVVVGWYVDTAGSENGFIYRTGKWAKLDYPNSTLTTELWGISNNGMIVGMTGGPRSFMYSNGTFKLVSYNSSPTEVRAVAPGGLLAGRVKLSDGYHGFVAACH
jgi:uncharacterized membrane protein